MKAREVDDFNDLVGRFVMVNVTMREHNGKMYSQANKMTYSKANDSLSAIPNPTVPVVQEQQRYAEPVQRELPVNEVVEIDIDEDSLPFQGDEMKDYGFT